MQEALDRLLDSLEVPAATRATQWDDSAGDGQSGPTENGSHHGMAEFVARTRWSRRPVYRMPRLLAAWAALVAGVCALIWIIFGLAAFK